MYPEDRLEAALRAGGDDHHDPDIAEHLAVARVLDQLHAVEVPEDVRRRLDRRIEHYLAARSPTELSAFVPRPRWRQALARPRARWSIAAAALLVLGLVVFGATFGVSRSLPGDPLYAIKTYEQQRALDGASSPLDASQIAIQQLQGALSDLQTTVNQQRGDSNVISAIAVVNQKTAACQDAVNKVSAPTDQTQAKSDLQQALANEAQILKGLLPKIGWSGRLATSTQLATIGVAVPHILTIAGTRATDGYHMTFTGSAFQPGATLYVDGHLVPVKLTITDGTAATAVLPYAFFHQGQHGIGVQNPDGTATQTSFQAEGEHEGGDDGSPGPGHGSPTPGDENGRATATPTGDRGHGTGTPPPSGSPTPDFSHRGTPTPGGGGD